MPRWKRIHYGHWGWVSQEDIKRKTRKCEVCRTMVNKDMQSSQHALLDAKAPSVVCCDVIKPLGKLGEWRLIVTKIGHEKRLKKLSIRKLVHV